MEKIIVKNFGPIKHAEIELKKVNVFIGPSSSGKSTMAKLVSIFKNDLFNLDNSITEFEEQLTNYNIINYANKYTEIEYKIENYNWTYCKGKISTNYPLSGVNISEVTEAYMDFIFFSDNSISKSKSLINLKNEIKELKKNTRKNSSISIITNKINDILSEIEIEKEDNSELKKLFNELKFEENKIRNAITTFQSAYIPTERIVFSIVKSLYPFDIPEEKINLPKYLVEFGNFYFTIRKYTVIEDDSIFKIDIIYDTDNQEINITQNNTTFTISEAASGYQSLIPALYTFYHYDDFKEKVFITFEEPELNIFPKDQRKLINFIVEHVNYNKCQLVLTTHSPYILSSLDNLILAHNTVKEKPRKKSKVKEIVPENLWLDFNNIAAYYFDPNPKRGQQNTKSIMDIDRKGIDANAIDDVSDEIGDIYDKLLSIRYS